jgi:hypothetical protein
MAAFDFITSEKFRASLEGDQAELLACLAAKACLAEAVITSKTAQLSVVVKDYRNLIHPGRSMRLSETVDENSTRVAQALVEMIVAEVAKKKSEKYGNTAEQLAAKMVVDPSAVGILDHLLGGMKEHEIERLLLKVIPDEPLFPRESGAITGRQSGSPSPVLSCSLAQGRL